MKTLFSFVVATFVLGFVCSADLVAGEKETETMLKKQGWTRLSVEELKAHKNYTAVGYTGWIMYVDPTGTNYVFQYYDGRQNRGKRKVTTAGKACYEGLWLRRRTPVKPGEDSSWECRSVWKKGKFFIAIKTEAGNLGPKYEITPGNTENL